jgi:immune inhibitor A
MSKGVRNIMRIGGFLLFLLGFAAPCLAIGPLPQTGLLGGGEPAAFRMLPDFVDVALAPAAVNPQGTCKALVLLVDFVDEQADAGAHDASFFRHKLFADDQTNLRGYFEANSYGRFTLTGDVAGWFRSACRYDDFVNRDDIAGTADDYGLDMSPDAVDPAVCEWPLNVWGVVAEAVALADAYVDFSAYDNDGPDGIPDSGDDDGYVDALFVVHAGPGAEIFGGSNIGVDYIWSMTSDLDYYSPTRDTEADGVKIGPFVLVPELGEIGVYAHEFCHLLGLPDLYNSVTGEPVVGPFCLMDEGAWNGPAGSPGSVPCHLSAPMKNFLGWVDPDEVCLGCAGPDRITGALIEALALSPRPVRVLNNPGGVDWSPSGGGRGEYFMLENRQRGSGYFESYLPASGLVIWKVDESRPDNNNPARRLAEIIQADGEVVDPDVPGRNVPNGPSDVWPGSLGKTDFTPTTFPASNLSGGVFSGVAVENIAQLSNSRIEADIRVGAARKGGTYAFPNPYSLKEHTPMRIVFLPELGPDVPYSFVVRVFDLEGNLVRTLDRGGEILDDGTAVWDARDESGNKVDPGLYFYSVESSGQQATGTIGIEK